MMKLHPAESTQASEQATKQHKFMKEARRECCLLKGPTACLTRSKARRYRTLLESSGKEEIRVLYSSVGPTSEPCLTRCNAHRFSRRFVDCVPSMETMKNKLTADVSTFCPFQLLHKRLMRILCRNKCNDSELIIEQSAPCKN